MESFPVHSSVSEWSYFILDILDPFKLDNSVIVRTVWPCE